MLVEKKKILFSFVILILLITAIYGINTQPKNEEFFKSCGYIILIIDCFLAVRNRHNIMLFFIYTMMLYFNFSFMYDLYFMENPYLIVFYNAFSNDIILGKGIYMMLIFSTILLGFDLLSDNNFEQIKSNFFIKKENKNLIISWGLFLIALVSGSIWWQFFEYSGAVLIIALYYSGNNRVFKIVVTIYIVYIFILLNIQGMRVPGLCFPIILIFMMYPEFVNYKYIIVGIVVAIIFMSYSGLYTDTDGRATILDGIDKLKSSAGALDTCQFSYMSSQIGIKVADDILSLSERLDYFIRFLKSQVVLSSKSIQFCKMCKITRQFYTHYDGQFMPHTFYFYLGWFGVVLSGFFVGWYLKLIKMLKENSKPVVTILSIWCIAMLPKWYLYEPNALLKGSLFILLLYWLSLIFNNVIRKNGNYSKKVKYINNSKGELLNE